MEEGMTQGNDERIVRYNQRIVEASEKRIMHKVGEYQLDNGEIGSRTNYDSTISRQEAPL
jgi:hypothetical protein